MNYKIENGISGPIIIFNDGLKQETYFDIPTNILNIIKELQLDNQQLELKLQQKEDIINKARDKIQEIAYGGNEDYYMEKIKSVLKILDNKGE